MNFCLNKIEFELNRFDPSSSGTVSSKEVGLILRYVGHNPTEAELQVNTIFKLIQNLFEDALRRILILHCCAGSDKCCGQEW